MSYITIGELSEKWGVSTTYIRRLCSKDEIPGAILKNGIWMVMEDAVRVSRTVREHTEEPEFPKLAKRLRNQKKKRNFHGLYDFVMIYFTYSSSRMASCRLTLDQIETIYKKGKVRESFEPMKVSDLIEALNHFHCIDYVLDNVMEPLTQKFIRRLHELLMVGSVDAYLQRVRPGEYRTVTSPTKPWVLVPANQINVSLNSLIQRYESVPEIERNHILDFHVQFEEIFPFEDGNGRIGRLIMFKECLRHEIMPFIIDDKRRSKKELREDIIQYLHALPLNYDIEVNGCHYKLVHGAPTEEYEYFRKRYPNPTHFSVWKRWRFFEEQHGDYVLIFGHTPTIEYTFSGIMEVWFGNQRIGIDCGSGYSEEPTHPYSEFGRLACLRLDDMEVFYSEECHVLHDRKKN